MTVSPEPLPIHATLLTHDTTLLTHDGSVMAWWYLPSVGTTASGTCAGPEAPIQMQVLPPQGPLE